MHDFVRQPIHESIEIHAPLQRCFALSTRVDLVRETLGMQLVGGVTSGHVTADSRVRWRGWKFGLPTEHHTLITGFAAPRYAQATGDLNADEPGQMVAWFQDSQERGRFAFFQHDHFLRQSASPAGQPMTVLADEVRFVLPFGAPGMLVAQFVLAPHIRKLAQRRFEMIKKLAEGDGWQQ